LELKDRTREKDIIKVPRVLRFLPFILDNFAIDRTLSIQMEKQQMHTKFLFYNLIEMENIDMAARVILT
jgi:hypothetical protein